MQGDWQAANYLFIMYTCRYFDPEMDSLRYGIIYTSLQINKMADHGGPRHSHTIEDQHFTGFDQFPRLPFTKNPRLVFRDLYLSVHFLFTKKNVYVKGYTNVKN